MGGILYNDHPKDHPLVLDSHGKRIQETLYCSVDMKTHDIKTKHSKNLICDGYLKDISLKHPAQ